MLNNFREVWLVDFEFQAPRANGPPPSAWWPGISTSSTSAT